MRGAVRYYDRAGACIREPEQTPMHMVTSLRIAFAYGRTLPTAAKLRADFGMSRAASYRWRRAIKDALGIE